MAGDEIIAINGLKVTAQGFDKRIKDFKVGDKVEITLFNNDKIKQVALTLGEKQSGKLVLKGDVKATKQQKPSSRLGWALIGRLIIRVSC